MDRARAVRRARGVHQAVRVRRDGIGVRRVHRLGRGGHVRGHQDHQPRVRRNGRMEEDTIDRKAFSRAPQHEVRSFFACTEPVTSAGQRDHHRSMHKFWREKNRHHLSALAALCVAPSARLPRIPPRPTAWPLRSTPPRGPSTLPAGAAALRRTRIRIPAPARARTRDPKSPPARSRRRARAAARLRAENARARVSAVNILKWQRHRRIRIRRASRARARLGTSPTPCRRREAVSPPTPKPRTRRRRLKRLKCFHAFATRETRSRRRAESANASSPRSASAAPQPVARARGAALLFSAFLESRSESNPRIGADAERIARRAGARGGARRRVTRHSSAISAWNAAAPSAPARTPAVDARRS